MNFLLNEVKHIQSVTFLTVKPLSRASLAFIVLQVFRHQQMQNVCVPYSCMVVLFFVTSETQ